MTTTTQTSGRGVEIHPSAVLHITVRLHHRNIKPHPGGGNKITG